MRAADRFKHVGRAEAFFAGVAVALLFCALHAKSVPVDDGGYYWRPCETDEECERSINEEPGFCPADDDECVDEDQPDQPGERA